jgi:outer membrane lipoprotein-sorting protein
MILKNRQGETSERELRMEGLEVPDPNDGDKTMVVFDEPRDVKGTALLTYTHIRQPDDQWLYLPALKRVKRISSSNKSGPFMGSEFAYEDFTSQEVKKYKYKWLRDEPCGALTCFVVERYPQYENSGYTRQIVWMDQDEYRVQNVEYYDRKDQLLKILTLSDYRQYLDKYWRAHNLDMVNQQTGKSTQLTWSDYQFRVGLSDDEFTKTRLKRTR